jgi:hypothetical protein
VVESGNLDDRTAWSSQELGDGRAA